MKKSNIITGSLMLAMSVFAYVYSTRLKAKLPTDPLGPGTWPKWLSIALGFFSIILILQGILTKKENAAKESFDFNSEGFRRVCKLCGVLILFVALTYVVGIYLGLVFMVPTTMYLLGERKKSVLIGFTVGAIVFIFVVFKMLLMVPLPTGLFFK